MAGQEVDVQVRDELTHVVVRQDGVVVFEYAHPTEQATAERCAVIADRNADHDPDRDVGAEIRAEFGVDA